MPTVFHQSLKEPSMTNPSRQSNSFVCALQRARLSIALVELIGWLGSAAGVAGALILALNEPWSGVGWNFFLASNTAWIVYAFIKNSRSLLLMQVVFTFTSLLGIYRWAT